MITVLFACVHNAGRSQMAAAWFTTLADPNKAQAISAGTNPASHVHPVVVAAMREAGIDISDARPQQLTDALAADAHWLITLGCDEECPAVPGVRREDWLIEDPATLPIERVRAIRDELYTRVEAFLEREHL